MHAPPTAPAQTITLNGREYYVAQVYYGQSPDDVRRVAEAMGTSLARDLRAEIEQVRSDLDSRLTRHEQTAADAAALAAERDRATADQLAQVVAQLGEMSVAIRALTARIDPLETEAERDKWRAEGARQARAEHTGAHPSPLVVMPSPTVAVAPAPADHGLALGRWTPTHVVLLASIAAVVLTGATVDWAAVIQQVLTVPTITPPTVAP